MTDLILVNGMPGVGKSALAGPLAESLGLPRLGKDDIKEALWDTMERPAEISPLDWTRRLGQLAYQVLWRLAERVGPRLVIDAPLSREWHAATIHAIVGRPIEVFLWAEPEILIERHRTRRAGQPHPCHLPHPLPSFDEIKVGASISQPLRLGGPLLELDTSEGVDVRSIAAWVRPHLAQTDR